MLVFPDFVKLHVMFHILSNTSGQLPTVNIQENIISKYSNYSFLLNKTEYFGHGNSIR